LVERPDFDVIVAGAGAGGAAAACYLTQAGLSVLVVEKALLPRYKACGGAIPRPTLERLPYDFDSVIQAAPAEVRFTFPGRPTLELPIPDRSVVMVMRSEFDAFLLARSGAEVLDGTAVTGVIEDDDEVRVQVGERTLTARYLVGADGATSQVARSLGLRRNPRFGGTLEAEVPMKGNGALKAEYGERAIFAMSVIPWGYAWVFPKGDSLSVGIGRFRSGRADLRAGLQREMDRLGIPLNGTRLHGHPLPCYHTPPWPLWGRRWQERLSTRRCLLVGDAAGLVDPLVGEGIRYAMSSARLAVESILRDDLSDYEAAIWREIGHSLATAGMAANTYYRLPWLGYQIGLRNPASIRLLVDVLTERSSYEGIGRRILAATARWFLEGKGLQEEHSTRKEKT
jgi:geranylgeranyl reductase family protein